MISRERIEQVRERARKHKYEMLMDALTALDERERALKEAITTLEWMMDYCSTPNPIAEARRRIEEGIALLRGGRYEVKE